MRNLKSAFVVIKGKKINGFYILQRSTIIGITVVSTLESISKTTRLCDRHFGHTSERGFTILNKQDLPRGRKENLIFVGIMYLETMEGKFNTIIDKIKGNLDTFITTLRPFFRLYRMAVENTY